MTPTPFDDLVRIGINLTYDSNGKKQAKLPAKWQTIKNSI